MKFQYAANENDKFSMIKKSTHHHVHIPMAEQILTRIKQIVDSSKIEADEYGREAVTKTLFSQVACGRSGVVSRLESGSDITTKTADLLTDAINCWSNDPMHEEFWSRVDAVRDPTFETGRAA